MKHSDFKMGMEFTCGTNRWRVTDVGSRTITAIMITNVAIGGVLVTDGERIPKDIEILTTAEATAQGWFNGPPYAVGESVFDENDIEGCEPVK